MSALPTGALDGRRRQLAIGLVLTGIVVMLLALPIAGAAAANPKGNNGTVKIDGVALQGGQSNEPHVDCEFAVEFFGYDKGDLSASVTFTLQSPTRRSSGSQVLLTDSIAIGEDPAGGATDLDASKLYQLDFTGVQAHAQQGYHVKLTVNAEGSQGADVKHKVFWVQACPAPTTTTTTTVTTTPPSTTPTTEATVPTTTPTTAAVLGESTTTTIGNQVLGEQVERAALPRTGTGLAGLMLLGGLALVLGGLISLLSEPEAPTGAGLR
jgi:hypothetical protein